MAQMLTVTSVALKSIHVLLIMVKMVAFLIVVLTNKPANKGDHCSAMISFIATTLRGEVIMLCLNKDVYRVCGVKRSIIYDFNKNVLYHLNFEASQLLNSVIDCGKPMSLQKDSLDFIQNLKVKGILTNQYIPTHDISDLIVTPVIDFVWIEVTTVCNLRCVHC